MTPAGEIASLGPWLHNLHLPDGAETAPDSPLGDFPALLWRNLAPLLPEDLRGWRALDVGCNAGFYSIELARRGARVHAVDHDPHYLRQARWAVERFGLEGRVLLEQADVYELGRRPERYDLVLFLGVFYHLRYPLLALDLLAERTRRLLLFQSLTLPGGVEGFEPPPDLALDRLDQLRAPGWPMVAFLEHRVADDPSNWWAPDRAASAAMLRSSGLSILERTREGVHVCEPRDDEPAFARARRRRELAAALGLAERR